MRNTSVNSKTFIVSFLVINAFSWYFPLNVFLSNVLTGLHLSYQQTMLVFGCHYLGVLLFAVIGTAITDRILQRKQLLSVWVLTGVLSSASMILLKTINVSALCFLSFFLGVSLGIGFPACLALFYDNIEAERKGSVGGITIFLAFIGIFMVGLAINYFDFTMSILVLVLWRAVGLIALKVPAVDGTTVNDEKNTSYRQILSERPFILYMVPWIMFSLINFFHQPLQDFYWGTGTATTMTIVEFGIGSVAALIGGYASDRVGRKRLVISGYILIGMGYAVLSIFPTNDFSIATYTVLDGVSWGLFALLFFVLLWGDLAGKRVKDRYYLFGELPFLISSYISVIVTPYVSEIPMTASFSLSSFFLFIAVLPLMYAPETLSERRIKGLELKGYVQKAKRVKEKYA